MYAVALSVTGAGDIENNQMLSNVGNSIVRQMQCAARFTF